jgi:drug/metabolite transporter (DMT)-like permease
MNLGFAHNGIFVAIIAHGLIGATLVWDKVLLRRPETRNLFAYVFWLGFISIFGLILIPFGFQIPRAPVIALAFGAGLLHMAAMFFYYAALKAGEASQTLAIMGGFSPVATALISIPLLRNPIGGGMALGGFLLLVLGGFVMFISEKTDIRRVLPNVLVASVSYGLVNVLQKLAFDQTNFVSGYVFFTLGTFSGALMLLIPASWRRQILKKHGKHERNEPRNWFWYFVNRFLNGLGSFLVFYAISLTRPALVDAITGLRYAIIFGVSYGLTVLRPRWLREDFTGSVLFGKSLATALVVAGLVLVGLQGSGSEAQTSQFLPLKQGYSADHQSRGRPAPQPHVFVQDIFSQNRFENEATGRGRDGEADVGNGEQRHHSEEAGGQGHDSGDDQWVPDDPGEHAQERSRA